MIRQFRRPYLLLSLAAMFTILQVHAQTYTFTGNGNWSVSSNWANNTPPPSTLPAGDSIVISPSPADSCVLDIIQTISPGANLIVIAGAHLVISSGIFINSFPPAVTTDSFLNYCDVVIYGTVTSNPSIPVTARGFTWANHPSPVAGIDSTTVNTSAGNHWETTLPRFRTGDTYYMRAYAANDNGTAYGQEFSVTLPPVSLFGSIFTTTPTDQSASVTYSSYLSNSGCNTAVQRGVIYDTLPVTAFLPTHTEDGPAAPGGENFTTTINHLLPNRRYYLKVYAVTSEDQLLLGNQSKNFVTQPSIFTSAVQVTGSTTATATTTIQTNDGSAVTQRGLVWGTDSNPTLAGGNYTVDGSGLGTYTSNLTGLTPGVTYYVRGWAVDGRGLYYGDYYWFVQQ